MDEKVPGPSQRTIDTTNKSESVPRDDQSEVHEDDGAGSTRAF